MMDDDRRTVTITSEHVRAAMGAMPRIVAALLAAEVVAGALLAMFG